MNILIFSNIPAPYFVEYLNELGKKADVYAVFERRKASNRDKSWEDVDSRNFNYKFLNGVNVKNETAFSLQIIHEIISNKDRIIIFANPTTPTGIVGITFCKAKRIPYVLQSEGGLPKNGKGFKERFKKHLLKGASLYLTGMKPEEDYFTAYGAPLEKVKQYPFASLAEKDLIKEVPTKEEKNECKHRLGIKYRRTILYVGRMIHIKGVDILIRACQGLEDDVGVFLVGGYETEEYAELARKYNVHNLNFINHIQLEQLKDYYIAADIFVLPTRSDTWGLVINEAMSYGLPIITTDACVAGTQLIENGVNGYIIESENVQELHERIADLLDDKELRITMGNNNHRKIMPHTYENMACVIYKQLLSCFKII